MRPDRLFQSCLRRDPMAKITVGTIEHQIDDMNFIAVELAWPYIEIAMSTVHPIAGTNAALAVIAAGLMESEGFDAKDWDIDPTLTEELPGDTPDAPKRIKKWPKPVEGIHIEMTNMLRRRLKASEMASVKLVLFEMIEQAGFDIADTVSGGALPVEEATASPSPETVMPISLNSSQPESKAEAGTLSENNGVSASTE